MKNIDILNKKIIKKITLNWVKHFSFFIKNNCRCTLIAILFLILSGCYRKIYISDQPTHEIGVMQRITTSKRPAQFLLCGDIQYSCPTYYRQHEYLSHSTYPHHQQKGKDNEKSAVKKTCVIK